MFANRISWRKITITSLTEATVGTTTNVRHKRNKIVTLNVTQKFCVQARKRPETFWQTLARTRPRTLNPARPEKPGPNYNSAMHAKSFVGCFIRFRSNNFTRSTANHLHFLLLVPLSTAEKKTNTFPSGKHTLCLPPVCFLFRNNFLD